MQSIALSNLSTRTPVLGFGCSAVMGRVGRKASLAALAAAYDAGVIFYDTARSYGYGESEALLGEFLRGRRDQVLVSTKFGIRPASASRPEARAEATRTRAAAAWLRALAWRCSGSSLPMSSAGHFSVAALHQSLDESLRALCTDYVDFLFLHEPPSQRSSAGRPVRRACEKLVAAGKVRRFGIASQPEVIEAAIAARVRDSRPCNSPAISST